MNVTLTGLVLKSVKTNEYDRVITILTDKHGKINFYANGVRSLTNLNGSACQIFSYSEFVLRKKADYYTLVSASCKNHCIRYDIPIEDFALASYIAELSSIVATMEENNYDILKQTVNALYILNKSDRSSAMVKAVYELRLLTIAGFMPDIFSCPICGNETDTDFCFFHLLNGSAICSRCKREKNNEHEVLLHRKTVEAIKYILTLPDEKAYSLILPEEVLKELSAVAERYVTSQLETRPSTLDYYKKMLFNTKTE